MFTDEMRHHSYLPPLKMSMLKGNAELRVTAVLPSTVRHIGAIL
jgi:hypothetical protein